MRFYAFLASVLDNLGSMHHSGPMNNNTFASLLQIASFRDAGGFDQPSSMFSAALPTLFKMVKVQMASAHKVLVETYGVSNLRGALMTTKQDANRLNAISAVMNNVDGTLNTDKVTSAAMKSAKMTVEAMEAKVAGKVGKLSGVTVRHVNGCEFDINGTDASGRAVQLIQTTVYKFSPNGTMFAQFPCRIYVDGKFTAEAAF